MDTKTFLNNIGLKETYKGTEYIIKIINECDYFDLIETPMTKIIEAIAKIKKRTPTSVKRDILYAKNKHLENMNKEIKEKIFEKYDTTNIPTKNYIIALMAAIYNSENILPTKTW